MNEFKIALKNILSAINILDAKTYPDNWQIIFNELFKDTTNIAEKITITQEEINIWLM